MLNQLLKLEKEKTESIKRLSELDNTINNLDKLKYKISNVPTVFYKLIATVILALLSIIFIISGIALTELVAKQVMLFCGVGTVLGMQKPFISGIKQYIQDKKLWKTNKENMVEKYLREKEEVNSKMNNIDLQIAEIIKKSPEYFKPKKLPLKQVIDESDKVKNEDLERDV